MQDRTILIVTRCAEIAQLLSRMLEAGGYVPDVASRSDALVHTAAVVHPALVLLDCDHEAVRQLDALAPAVRGRITLFSPNRLADEVRPISARHDLPFLELPVGPRALLRFVRGRLRHPAGPGAAPEPDRGAAGDGGITAA